MYLKPCLVRTVRPNPSPLRTRKPSSATPTTARSSIPGTEEYEAEYAEYQSWAEQADSYPLADPDPEVGGWPGWSDRSMLGPDPNRRLTRRRRPIPEPEAEP